MANFVRTPSRNVGTSPVTIFTATSNTVVIGLSVANIYGRTLPVKVWHDSSGVVTYILKDLRIGPGETEEYMKGNKIVLQTGDTLKAQTVLANGFDVYVSVLEGLA